MTRAATAAGTWLREASAVPARAADGADAMPSSFRYAQHHVRKRLSAIDAVAIVNVIASRPAALLVERWAIPGRRAIERRGTGAVAEPSYQAYREHGGGPLVRSTSKEVTD